MTIAKLYEMWKELADLLERGASIYDEEVDRLMDCIEDGFQFLLEIEKMMPCPLCGSTRTARKSMVQYYIRCNGCGATGPNAPTKDEASNKWNTRPMLAHYINQIGRWVKHWRGLQ